MLLYSMDDLNKLKLTFTYFSVTNKWSFQISNLIFQKIFFLGQPEIAAKMVFKRALFEINVVIRVLLKKV